MMDTMEFFNYFVTCYKKYDLFQTCIFVGTTKFKAGIV